MVEIVETEETPRTTAATLKEEQSRPLLDTSESKPRSKSVRTKVPEVEVHLFRRGEGPIDIFKSSLGGWDQDQLEVRDILDKYGFKSLYAYNTQSGRGVPIRFNGRNGRSILPYKDGSVIFADGEPKVELEFDDERSVLFSLKSIHVGMYLPKFTNEYVTWGQQDGQQRGGELIR